jgi:hypothetical protein
MTSFFRRKVSVKGDDLNGLESVQNEYGRPKGQAEEVHDLRGLGAAEKTLSEIFFKIMCSEQIDGMGVR